MIVSLCDTVPIRSGDNRNKKKKSPGNDNISPEMLLKSWNQLKEPFASIFNNSLRNKTFPKQWKELVLKVILKNSEKDSAEIDSYRPMALLPVAGKTI